jgi:hypothetical protein
MKFSIGDKIILKQSGEEGYVVAYINPQMLEVEVNGVNFPAYIDDIDHPYLKWFTEKNKEKKVPSKHAELPIEKEKNRTARLSRGVYLSFIPVYKTEEMEDIVDHLKIYMLNELPVPVRLTYEVRFQHQSVFKHEGSLHKFGNIYLHNIPYTDMNDQPRFHWSLTDISNPNNGIEEGILKIRPSKLFEHINQLQINNEASFSYLLIDDFTPKKKTEKKEKFELPVKPAFILSPSSKNLEAPIDILDLHIEQLLDDVKGMSNAEILKMQLDTFLYYLHLAIVHHRERMVVIHGLGKGKLRDEVHRILKHTPEVRLFTNEWQGSYGFGATEIYFKY